MSKEKLSVPIELPPIPAKRYFTISEVSELCGVKPHVLRYWEAEFTQLNPLKRSNNRRYYQHHEVLLIRKIRALLYEQGFTISGARQQLGGEAYTPLSTTKVHRFSHAELKKLHHDLTEVLMSLERLTEHVRQT